MPQPRRLSATLTAHHESSVRFSSAFSPSVLLSIGICAIGSGMTQAYSQEIKAQAIARVLAGEHVGAVARDMSIERVTVSQWLRRKAVTVTAVVTSPTLRDRMETFLAESMETLTAHAVHYRSAQWLQGQPADVLESTRTLGSRLTAIVDRLGGAPARAEPPGD